MRMMFAGRRGDAWVERPEEDRWNCDGYELEAGLVTARTEKLSSSGMLLWRFL
jgi:hypothetical protein